jgi:hypothetical protein
MDFFSYMPSNLFNLFYSKNRSLYAECLIKLFKEYEKGSILGMEKSHAQETIIDILEKYQDFELEEDEKLFFEEDETQEIDLRDKANFILRKLEKTGWIDIDINYDYQEIVNFFDYSISLIEAFIEIERLNNFGDVYSSEVESEDRDYFKGYVYTIYTLLCSNDNPDYAMVLDQVYKNTISFIRELRKIDSRMKYYLNTMVEKTDLKDLMVLLISHKDELMSNSYLRLKTSDNVNKYKFNIIRQLEDYQMNGLIMNYIANEYMSNYHLDYNQALSKVNKQIDEIIDVFNAFDDLIHSIDEKNRNYINSTLTKIKFLLNVNDDIVGQITKILKFAKREINMNREKTLFDKISKCFVLYNQKNLSEHSYYTPRGNYSHNETNEFTYNNFDFSSLRDNFFKEYKTNFSEKSIMDFIQTCLKDRTSIKASELIESNTLINDEDMIRLLYVLIYSNLDDSVYTYQLTEKIKSDKYDMNDFVIARRVL